jgi:hypothetical protein
MSDEVPDIGSSAERRREIGRHLKRAREDAKQTTVTASDHLGCSHSKISKIESGKAGVRTSELRALMEFYAAPESELQILVRMNDIPRDPEWWKPYRAVVPKWFQRFLSLEAGAVRIMEYQLDIVPGLLQTEDYARAVLASWEPEMGTGPIRRSLELRMARQQQVLDRSRPVRFTAVIGEAALHRRVGDDKVMYAQLTALLRAGEQPDTELCVLPFDAASFPVIPSAMTLFEMPTDEMVVYLQDVVDASYIDKPPGVVGRHAVVFSRLRAAALEPADSARLIARLAAKYR